MLNIKHWRIFILLGAVVLIGMLIQLSIQSTPVLKPGELDPSQELKEIQERLEADPFVDKKDLFTLVRPFRWRITADADNSNYNVIFSSPNGPDIRVLATEVPHNSFEVIAKRVEKNQNEFGILMNIETNTWNQRKVIKRLTRLHDTKVMAIDFVENHVAHHIQFSAPMNLYDQYLPVVLQVLETYQPAKRKN